MEEQRALDGEHRGGGHQEGDERRAVLHPASPGGRRRHGDRREPPEPEPREAEHDREVQARGDEGDLPGRGADPDGAVPQVAPPGGMGQQHRERDRARAGGHRCPPPGRHPSPPGADQHRRREGDREELDQYRGCDERTGRGRRERPPGGRDHRERHQPQGDRRYIGAHHGGPVDDGRRQPDQESGGASGDRTRQGADDEGRGEDAAEAEQQRSRPHEGGIASGHRRHRAEAHEEERRLRREHLRPEGRAIRDGDGASQVDALVELGRVDRQVAPRGDRDDAEHEGEAERLGSVLRGPGAAAHRRPRYRVGGGSTGSSRRRFNGPHRAGDAPRAGRPVRPAGRAATGSPIR